MRSGILKFLAVISFGLVTFPFVLTNDVLAFENISVLRILAYYFAFGIVFGFGYAFGKATLKRRKLVFAGRIIGILTFGIGLVMLAFTKEINIIFAVGASAVLWYFLGERASRKHYADIFPAFMFGVYICVTLLCYLFYGAMCPRELKEPVQSAVIAAFMIELCLAALLINQSGIYDKANRRRETRTMLPKGLSGYNAALVLAVTMLGLFLYLFTDKIVWLLNELVRLVIKAALFIMKGYSEFMATEAVDYNVAEGSGYTPAETNDLWNLVFIIILIAVVIIFRKKIFSYIKELFKRIYGFFSRETEISEDEPEFTDVFEELDSSRRRNSGDVSLSRLMKLYRSETDPIKKYRFGYGLLLRQLRMCKADIREADTVSVQHEKGRAICGAELKSVTDSYDRLRYNDSKVTDEELKRLDELIRSMNGMVKA